MSTETTLPEVIAQNMAAADGVHRRRTAAELYNEYRALRSADCQVPADQYSLVTEHSFHAAAAEVWNAIHRAALDEEAPSWAIQAAGVRADSYAREAAALQVRIDRGWSAK